MCEAQLASMAYFHFDFRDIHKQSRRDVISSLLFQLSTQSNRRHDILYRSFLAQDSGAQRPSDSILTECLKDMLLMPSEVPIYIIMDAIDECPNTSGIPSSRKEILDLVEELIGLSLPNLRLCVTNRSDFDIRVVLEPLSSFRVSLHDEIGQKQDIANYIKAVVYSDPKMRIWRAEDKELVINVLTERADGMSGLHFWTLPSCSYCLLSRLRWVFFQLEALRRCSPPNIRRVLDEFPEMLGETYERILMEIGNEKREYARRLLQCVAVAIRPLRVEELAEVLAVDFDTGGAIPKHHLGRRQEDQEAVILSTCSSLVTIANIDDSKVVQLSHFSVNAFLTSNRLATSSGRVSFYHISLETAHTIIAQACLGVLLRLKDHLDRDNVEKIPLAEYAAKHWVDHARFENVAFHVQERMELLFDPEEPYFANWLRIYDMDEPLGTPHLIRPAPLYYAALCGLPSLAERLIVKRPMDVNARGGHYVTAIQAALYKRHLSIVRVLMEHGVDVNLRDDEGMSLLHLAAQIGDPEAVSLLMSRGTDVDSGHSSMLFMALNSGNLAETRLLLDHGVDANARDEKLSTALHISSDNGYFDLVRLLLQYGADVNPRDNHDSTPLHLASAKGHSRVVSLLMNYGADMNASDNTNSTPLRLAFINQDLGIAELLIESGADVNVLDRVLDNKPLAPLHLALSKGNARLVNLLVRRGINVNGRDDNNMTPLHLASAKGNHTAVGLLIDHAAEVNASDNTNSTPLHLALINENFDIALLLIERSAHVTVADNKKLVPLHLALLSKNFDLVDLLIGLGADVNACSNDNSTPLHVASRHGHRKFVDLLLEHGGDPNLRNDSGFSPLHIASLEGDVDIAESLLEGGAKANLKDWNRKTPLHLASNNKKMARLLIRHGADAFALDNKDAMPLRYGEDIERARRMAENTVTLGAHV